jgi:hypothetical protein
MKTKQSGHDSISDREKFLNKILAISSKLMFLSYAAKSEQQKHIARNSIFTLQWTLEQYKQHEHIQGQNEILEHWLKSINDFVDREMKLISKEEKEYLRIVYNRGQLT